MSIAVIGQGFVGGSLTTVFSERGETRETLANNLSAREELGWIPKVSLEDYLNEKLRM